MTADVVARTYTETEVVARVRGLTVTRLRAFVAADCLAPVEQEGRLAFAEADVARAALLEELVEDFDLDAEFGGNGRLARRPDPRPAPAAPPSGRCGRGRAPGSADADPSEAGTLTEGVLRRQR